MTALEWVRFSGMPETPEVVRGIEAIQLDAFKAGIARAATMCEGWHFPAAVRLRSDCEMVKLDQMRDSMELTAARAVPEEPHTPELCAACRLGLHCHMAEREGL